MSSIKPEGTGEKEGYVPWTPQHFEPSEERAYKRALKKIGEIERYLSGHEVFYVISSMFVEGDLTRKEFEAYVKSNSYLEKLGLRPGLKKSEVVKIVVSEAGHQSAVRARDELEKDLEEKMKKERGE